MAANVQRVNGQGPKPPQRVRPRSGGDKRFVAGEDRAWGPTIPVNGSKSGIAKTI